MLAAIAAFQPWTASGQFRKEAFSQSYNNDDPNAQKDSTEAVFSFAEFFGGLKHEREARIGTMFAGSTILVGAQQIYNRQYWKLPIVYGAIMGCAYAIMWNGNMYADYKQAYIDIMNDEVLSDDPTRSYNAILPRGYTIEKMGGRSTYTQTLNNKQNLYRRYRDFGIAGAVVVYALSLIDAFVDAQLFDFDISPDLSMNVSPQIYNDYIHHQRAAEVRLAITFK